MSIKVRSGGLSVRSKSREEWLFDGRWRVPQDWRLRRAAGALRRPPGPLMQFSVNLYVPLSGAWTACCQYAAGPSSSIVE